MASYKTCRRAPRTWKGLRHLFFLLCHPPLSPRRRMFDFLRYVSRISISLCGLCKLAFLHIHLLTYDPSRSPQNGSFSPQGPESIPCGYWPGSECLDSKVSGERLCQVSLPKVCPSPRSGEAGQGGPSHAVTVPLPAVFPRKKVEREERWAPPAGRASICWAVTCRVAPPSLLRT